MRSAISFGAALILLTALADAALSQSQCPPGTVFRVKRDGSHGVSGSCIRVLPKKTLTPSGADLPKEKKSRH
jgi:hypothetical protein